MSPLPPPVFLNWLREKWNFLSEAERDVVRMILAWFVILGIVGFLIWRNCSR